VRFSLCPSKGYANVAERFVHGLWIVDKTHQFMGFEEMEKQNDNSITLVHVLKVYFDFVG